jgi:catalase-peroxidase
MESEGKCPFKSRTRPYTSRDWWPNQLNLQVLHRHSSLANPTGESFDYAQEFKSRRARERREASAVDVI